MRKFISKIAVFMTMFAISIGSVSLTANAAAVVVSTNDNTPSYSGVDGMKLSTTGSAEKQKLNLYILCKNDANYWSFQYYVNFYAIINDKLTQLGWTMFCMDYDQVDTINGDMVYHVVLPIPEGQYCLAMLNGNNTYAYTLTRDYCFPIEGEGYYITGDTAAGNNEWFTVSEGEVITAYMMYGSNEWLYDRDVIREWKIWAQKNDAEFFNTLNTLLEDTAKEEDKQLYTQDELNAIISNANNNTPVVEEVIESIVEEKIEPVRETTTTTIVLETPVEEEKKIDIGPFIRVGIVVIVFIGIAIIVVKRRNR